MTRIYQAISNGDGTAHKGELIQALDGALPLHLPDEYIMEIDLAPLPDGTPRKQVITRFFYSAGVAWSDTVVTG